MNKRINYPFTAIVGQDSMKEALILNTILPSIGGVLIKGEKGTAKSTSVRALAELLPERSIVKGCACGCSWGEENNMCPDCQIKSAEGKIEQEIVPMQVIELPLNSTEDRVAGTLDIEHAITAGKKRFEPGVLAKANGNILYVDEVNLLDDHLVDLLLDAAAMGVNFIEREGVSFSHPSKFVLVGTMNPEEGELRPQLLDRFGLMVSVKGETDTRNRVEVIRRRISFEKDPDSFIEEYVEMQNELKSRILEARKIINIIEPDDAALDAAVKLSMAIGVDGHRADLTLVKTAMAKAAFDKREKVFLEDIKKVSRLVLPHRMRRNPFQDSTMDAEDIDKWLQTLVV
mgnify:CR=1 FL=1